MEREPITEVWGRAPAGSRGRAPGGGQGAPEAESFSSIFIQRAKGLVFKLKKTPMFGPWGGARSAQSGSAGITSLEHRWR